MKTLNNILFIEERPSTIEKFKVQLEKDVPHINIIFKTNLEAAIEFLNENDKAIDMIIIDLEIPPIPESLGKYRKKFRSLDLNHGQCLGMYLSDEKEKYKAKIPYVYLSAMPFELDRRQASQKNALLFEKTYNPERFPKKLNDIYQKWKPEEHLDCAMSWA